MSESKTMTYSTFEIPCPHCKSMIIYSYIVKVPSYLKLRCPKCHKIFELVEGKATKEKETFNPSRRK